MGCVSSSLLNHDDEFSQIGGASVLSHHIMKGRYIGGAEEVLRIVEEGTVGKLFQDLPKLKVGGVCACEGCGGVGFLPCFTCHGSCKTVIEESDTGMKNSAAEVLVIECHSNNQQELIATWRLDQVIHVSWDPTSYRSRKFPGKFTVDQQWIL